MLQFIHNDFKLDLTHLKVTFNTENIWFKSEINSDYSFPFEIPWNEWTKISNSVHSNAVGGKIKFEGKLYRDGNLSSATLKVQEVKGKFVSCMIYTGFEGFPSFDKQLKDLPLDVITGINIKTHARELITKEYPEVSHNFPMIHTDKYDPTSEEFNGFEKVINKFVDGNYVESELDAGTNVDVIKNIMQPLPYLMHIVTKGFEADGYTLAGDILEIEDFKKALVFRDGDYYRTTGMEEIPFQIPIQDFVSSDGFVSVWPSSIEMVTYFKEITIDKKGDYILFGDIKSIQYKRFKTPLPFLYSTLLYYKISRIRSGVETNIMVYFKGRDADQSEANPGFYIITPNRSVDINISFEPGDILRFEKKEARRDVNPPILEDYPFAIDMRVIPLRYYESDGTPILSILDKNEVDLKQVVPDMTFSELIERLMLVKKLDLEPSGNFVYMNFIKNKFNRNNAKLLSEHEVEEPLIKFNEERTYELSFADGKSNETYKYDSIYVTSEGFTINDYTAKKDTTPISIDLLPYPIVKRGDITTAFAFDEEVSKLRLVFFNKVSIEDDELLPDPVCYENTNMLIPGIYKNDYKDWLLFLINSKTYQWDFIMSVEKFREITAQSLIYAYNNYHIFTEIEQERINRLYWRISAKTETLI
jgi:hypothetical protein